MTEETFRSGFRFREPIREGLEEIVYLCDEIIYSGRSPFQQIDIVDTRLHGRMLFLDGVAQSAEYDEFIYHEMLVHPALFSCPDPKSVLVIGGAEGASLREIFRHKGIERVVMVDIDGELVDLCKRHLVQWHQGSFEDPRLELIVDDGLEYIEKSAEKFDTVIMDISDPVEGSPSASIFSRKFYQLVRDHLTPGGSVCTQGEGISPQEVSQHAEIYRTLKSVFPISSPILYSIQSFHRPDAHILAVTDPDWSIDLLVQRSREASLPLRYFSPEIARGMFCLPPYLHQAYKRCETYSPSR